MKCGHFSVRKNGKSRGRNRYRCNVCRYQWIEKRGKRTNYKKYYSDWLLGRRTLSEISKLVHLSYPKLTEEFDKINIEEGLQYPYDGSPINLLIDATFFGREYGFLVFHDTRKVIYFKEIITESVKDLREGLFALKEVGYVIKSITIDGRRGYHNTIRKVLGNIPIQMCLFHQRAIIRRYITDNPRSKCGQELKELAKRLADRRNHQSFINDFFKLKEKYQFYLLERNENQEFKHQAIRSAFKSLESNLAHIFLYSDSETLNIPPTINHLEGLFSHLKERVKIHRGLKKNRKKKAVRFLLKNLGKIS